MADRIAYKYPNGMVVVHDDLDGPAFLRALKNKENYSTEETMTEEEFIRRYSGVRCYDVDESGKLK